MFKLPQLLLGVAVGVVATPLVFFVVRHPAARVRGL